jgi:hypothetical protein
VPTTISHKVNTQNNIHGKFPSQTIERKFPSSGEPVPNNSGGARRAGWFLLQNLSPPPQSFPHLLKLEKSQKNLPLRFPVTSLNQKDLLLKIEIKSYVFLSVFSVLMYIFEEVTNVAK